MTGTTVSGPRPLSRVFVGTVVVAMVPILVAAISAVTRDWAPLGDDAIVAIRAHDVFTHNVPLLGMWSSASLNAGVNLNHPGPLLYDLLAMPVRVFGYAPGTAFGMAILNGLAIVGIAVFAFRRGGALLGAAATTMAAVLCWTAGSEVLYEPWPAHAMVLPFLLFIVLVWSACSGDLVAVPWAVGVGSLVVQTHLSYTLLVPALLAFAVVVVAGKVRDDRRRDAARWPDLWARIRRLGALSVIVGVVCWVQPLIEQLTSTGDGNLTRLADSITGSEVDRAGFGYGARLLATVVSLPPWWFRPSFRDSFVRGAGWSAPSPAATAGSLAALVIVLAVCWWFARRAGDRECLLAVTVGGVGLALAFATVAVFPLDNFDISTHSLRWMWPLGAFITFAIVATAIRRMVTADRTGLAVGALAVVTLIVAALNLPTSDQGRGPNSDQYAFAGVNDLAEQASPLAHGGPVLVDSLFLGRFGDPYGPGVLAALDEQGMEFVVEEPMLVRHFGPDREFDGTNARNELLLRQGDEARDAPPRARRVALSEGLPAGERHELADLRRQISDYVRAGRLELNDAGRRALVAGALPHLSDQLTGPVDPEPLFDSREISVIGESHWLAGDGRWQRRFERFAELQGRADARTVALFVRPVEQSR